MRGRNLAAAIILILLTVTLVGVSEAQRPDPSSEEARIQQGFRIAPVPLKFRKNVRDLVGLGSYIVNAQGGCNDCHTNPPYAPGGNPFEGEPEQINTEHYLAGGTSFGPVVSANITPDSNGRPHGLTFGEFLQVLQTGHDPDDPDEILQVMPWPVFGKMTRRDLRAVYEYLSAIPHAEPAE
jgi:hypothetical protein